MVGDWVLELNCGHVGVSGVEWLGDLYTEGCSVADRTERGLVDDCHMNELNSFPGCDGAILMPLDIAEVGKGQCS